MPVQDNCLGLSTYTRLWKLSKHLTRSSHLRQGQRTFFLCWCSYELASFLAYPHDIGVQGSVNYVLRPEVGSFISTSIQYHNSTRHVIGVVFLCVWFLSCSKHKTIGVGTVKHIGRGEQGRWGQTGPIQELSHPKTRNSPCLSWRLCFSFLSSLARGSICYFSGTFCQGWASSTICLTRGRYFCSLASWNHCRYLCFLISKIVKPTPATSLYTVKWTSPH